jgi:Chaperone of endosialidase
MSHSPKAFLIANITNESKATMFSSPTFTGTVSGVTAAHVGLGNVTNESKATMFTSPAFTGTPTGITASHVGLGSVENTALSTWAGSSNLTTVGTLGSVQITSLGIGTAASGTTGEIRATNNITGYYTSDRALKENIRNITGALDKVRALNGVMFDWKQSYIEERGGEDGYFVRKADTGVIAQEVEAVLPEVVGTRENGTKAVAYEKLAGLLIESIKELDLKVEEIKRHLGI